MVWAIFAFELGVMTYLAPNRWRYLREHWIDVLTVLVPFLGPSDCCGSPCSACASGPRRAP